MRLYCHFTTSCKTLIGLGQFSDIPVFWQSTLRADRRRAWRRQAAREVALSGSEVASGIVAWRGHVQVNEVAGVASGCQG